MAMPFALSAFVERIVASFWGVKSSSYFDIFAAFA
jgi:hypothetical protein